MTGTHRQTAFPGVPEAILLKTFESGFQFCECSYQLRFYSLFFILMGRLAVLEILHGFLIFKSFESHTYDLRVPLP